MIDLLRQIILCITAASLFCAVALSLVPEGGLKEVIRMARRDIVGHLEEKARRDKSRLLRNIEWSMVMPRERLSEKHSKYLDKVLADNELLAALYPILGAVRSIWCAPSRAEAELQIDVAADLMREIKEKYGFPAAEGFADMLTSHKDGLLMAHKHRIGTRKFSPECYAGRKNSYF